MPERSNEISGLMVTAIVGGALLPPLMGLLADATSVSTGFLVPLACAVYLLIVGLVCLRKPATPRHRLTVWFHPPLAAMTIDQDQRIVMTLDAGGTKFAFSAVRAGREIVAPVVLPSNGHDLPLCLRTIGDGFSQIHAALAEKPVAISFAFPGPADYASGVIGDLANLPAFRGGVPLGPMLEEKFRLPVFINNDGDLFAYGEAIAGLLPQTNEKLAAAGAPKRYKNLLGVTLGTGFGAGIVHNGQLFLGDNGAAAEIWDLRSKLHPRCPAEEDVSIRAVERVYAAEAAGGERAQAGGADSSSPTPKEIFEIAMGRAPGDRGGRPAGLRGAGREHRRRAGQRRYALSTGWW